MVGRRLKSLRWVMLAVLLACGIEPTAPPSAPPSKGLIGGLLQLVPTLLNLRSGAPPLTATQVSFYAVKGEDRQGALFYASADSNPADSSELVRLTVPAQSLWKRPDGTLIATGDSVLITITVVDTAHMIVDMQPSGLRFAAFHPAQLEMSYAQADDDFNADGLIDLLDALIESLLRIWYREGPNSLWTPLLGLPDLTLKHIDTSISGFTQYAIAY